MGFFYSLKFVHGSNVAKAQPAWKHFLPVLTRILNPLKHKLVVETLQVKLLVYFNKLYNEKTLQ